jgi:hypothetical protein
MKKKNQNFEYHKQKPWNIYKGKTNYRIDNRNRDYNN